GGGLWGRHPFEDDMRQIARVGHCNHLAGSEVNAVGRKALTRRFVAGSASAGIDDGSIGGRYRVSIAQGPRARLRLGTCRGWTDLLLAPLGRGTNDPGDVGGYRLDVGLGDIGEIVD